MSKVRQVFTLKFHVCTYFIIMTIPPLLQPEDDRPSHHPLSTDKQRVHIARNTFNISMFLFLIKTRLPRRHSRDLLRYFAHQPILYPLEGFQFPSHTIPVRYGMFHALWLFSAPLTMWSGWLLLMLVFSLKKNKSNICLPIILYIKIIFPFFPVPWCKPVRFPPQPAPS